MNLDRREWLGGLAAIFAATAWKAVAQPSPTIVTPEMFGAVGDGKTNDTAAFSRMTAFVNRRGGGTVRLRATTYIIGRQAEDRSKGYAFGPTGVMDFIGCTGPLTVQGNGATIRCAPGLRFGTFDLRTGQPTRHKLPYYGTGELASPYFAMIKIEKCSGPVKISDLRLDGNASQLRIGGPWGDAGWQIGSTGVILRNNRAPILVANVTSFNHAHDGGTGDGPGVPGRDEQVTIRDCRFFGNGRNGWSLVGGIGWTFERCRFDFNGRGPGASTPKAGIDFEAEGGKSVAQIKLVDCSATNNAGVACLHPGSGRTSDVSWTGGRLVGTTTYAYRGGGNKGIRFSGTSIFGALTNLATEQFEDCTFSDDPSAAGVARLYNPYGFILPDAVAGNRFVRCKFVHARPGPSANGNFDGATFTDCTFVSARGAGRLDVYGRFQGQANHFIAEPGGTNFQVTPAGLGGAKSAGRLNGAFTLVSTDGSKRAFSRP